MSVFFLITSVLCMLASALLLFPIYRVQSRVIDRNKLNVQLFQERLGELAMEQDNGLISDEQRRSAVQELERNLLADVPVQAKNLSNTAQENKTTPGLLWILFLFIPCVSFLLYSQIGSHQRLVTWTQLKADITPALDDLAQGKGVSESLAKQPLDAVIHVLQARLQQEQETPQGWMLLALLYAQSNDQESSIHSFERALQLDPERSEIKLAYAETLIRQQQGVLTKKSTELLQAVLQQDPANTRALTFLAMGSYTSGFYEQAIVLWKQLLSLRQGQADDGKVALIEKSIAMAEQALRQKKTPDSPSVTQTMALDDEIKQLRSLIMAQGKLSPESESLLKSIFAQDPDNSQALAFQAMAAFNSGQYQRAINSWEQLLKQREPDSDRAALIRSSIEKAKAKLNENQ